jgi:NIMA (never in mitosis gene a)-related kinase
MSKSPQLGEKYAVLELIGRGSFGSVRKVRRICDDKILVRKEVAYGHMNPKERSQLVAEFRILSDLKNPNIVQYIEHDHLPEHRMIFLYMEYCDGGDLSSIIKSYRQSNEYIAEGIIWNIFTQTLMALYRCHYGVNSPLISNIYEDLDIPQSPGLHDTSKVIIHRDIKPDNIFLSNGSFKLGDFGLAKSLSHEVEFATTCVGTPYYMSPEVLLDKPYSPLCDIWSLGCVIYELCALKPPFQAKTHLQLQERILYGKYPEIPGHYSSSLRKIIESCIQVDLGKRASTFDLLQDLNFKIQMKNLQLMNYEINLKKFEDELMIKEQDLIKTKQILFEDLNHQKQLLEQETEADRLNYQNEFEYVVEREVNKRLRQITAGQSVKPPASTSPFQAPKNFHQKPIDYNHSKDPKHRHHLSEPEHSEKMMNRRALQLINDDQPISKKYTKPSNNSYSIPTQKEHKDNAMLTKNAQLFEFTKMVDDFDIPSPFSRKFNNDWV